MANVITLPQLTWNPHPRCPPLTTLLLNGVYWLPRYFGGGQLALGPKAYIPKEFERGMDLLEIARAHIGLKVDPFRPFVGLENTPNPKLHWSLE